ncbi:serine/threonine protein kinase, partial [Solirubrobacter taibaiensis]|nr:serine/threonine protein kinase [Solirubrobacter taibaiensis]
MTAPVSVAIATGTIIGGYRVVRVLGRGATAVVFEATSEEGAVALKVGDPADSARFLRGAQAQAGLDHPAIAAVHGYGTDPTHGPWLAMELVDGPLPDPLTVLCAVAAALDHAHAVGVVHRDVKPSNVLADTDRVLLADFGLAREEVTTAAGTRTGAVLGSLPYLAPELVRGGRATPASDRYALAAMAYELLTGDVPFPRRTDAAILFAHVDAPVPPASERRPELPPAVDAVLERGLAKEPSERYADATSFVAALDAALAGTDVPPPARRADDDATTRDAAPLGDGPWPGAAPARRSRATGWLSSAQLRRA